MKVYCINFQEIAEGQRTNALARAMFDRFRRLAPEKYIFLNSSIDKDYGPNIHGLNTRELFIFKLFEKVSATLKVPYYIRRTILEKIVDYFLCKRLKKETEPFLLISTMYAVRCTHFANQHGCKVLFWAGNLNDNLYYDVVKKEQKRLGLHYTDVYSSNYRIKVYRRMLKNVDYVFCPNTLTAWSFEGYNIILNPRPRVKAQMLYPKEYSPIIPESIVIGYFGHTTLLKGVHLLVEALPLCKNMNNIKIVIAGNVDGYVTSLLKKSNVQISFIGPIPEDKKWTTIKSFDYMVVPSLYDAGPGTIMEAFKCDVPVIVSSGCGDVERVKEDPKCIVFETMNINDLAKKIDYAYEKRDLFLKPSTIDNSDKKSSDDIDDLDVFVKIIQGL